MAAGGSGPAGAPIYRTDAYNERVNLRTRADSIATWCMRTHSAIASRMLAVCCKWWVGW